ncbi:MAG: ATP-binding protein, partial [SAR202 cluster bacterium]|nr:ATP-binding protein [SAR202 cluster bacterium]
ARRELISNNLNEFLEGFTSPDESTTIRPVAELIKMGEGSNLEFKSTLQWDVVEDRQNKALRDSVLKTLAAFMNSNGGSLLIGVEDSGHIFGLDKDLSILGGSQDRFFQLLSSLIADKIGPQYASLVNPQIEDLDGKKICVAKTAKSSEPAFLSGQRGREFFVRVGNTTRALDPEQTINYIEVNDL